MTLKKHVKMSASDQHDNFVLWQLMWLELMMFLEIH